MKRFLQFLAVALALLLPELVMAGTINPPGGSAWDLWVFGNGTAIYEILKSIKLLMVPVAGTSGYKTLLLVIAVLSFIVLAVSAGFDPAKNFMKMFTYVFVVWFISFGTTTLTVNVQVNDSLAANQPDVIFGVPALVAFPGILTGLVGKYFTNSIETNFSTVDQDGQAFLLGDSGVGQFNLFGKMLQESEQYVITVPELKKSLSQYVTDCVVPAMGMGMLSGPVPKADGSAGTETGYGMNSLLKSTNLMETLSSASNRSILTKYYPADPADSAFTTAIGVDDSGTSTSSYRTTGALLSCAASYDLLKKELEAHANNLLEGGNTAWAKAGVLPIYENAFKSMLVSSSLDTNGSPSGYIMQTAMINSMNGAFRQAAIQTGNNSMMQAAALSQAEASQWSAWSAGFSTFNNTMGYVYIVLQAFIFAITPLIIVALLIPGMGKSIFVNYAQILVWLTLWMPSLAIINYLIMLFATTSVGGVASATGGPSMANRALISESVNHLMVAAQFLGTMVPLISWGIVKGAMAFTEFISHGIGNQFASQAGAAAATGNMSMNNMSMDNTSMNKFSTMASSQVGFQGVSAGGNAGSLNMKFDGGGSSAAINGSAVNMKEATTNALSKGLSESNAVTKALQSMKAENLTEGEVRSRAAGIGSNSVEQKAAQMVLATMSQYQQSKDGGSSADAGKTQSFTDSHTQGESGSNSNNAKMGLNPGIPGIGLGGGMNIDSTQQNSTGVAHAGQDAYSGGAKDSVGDKTGISDGGSRQASEAHSTMSGMSHDASQRSSMDTGHSLQSAFSESISNSMSISATLGASLSVASSMDFANGVTLDDVGAIQDNIRGLQSSLGGATEGLQSSMSSQLASMDAQRNEFGHSAAARQAQIKSSVASYERGAAPGSMSVAAADANFSAGKSGANQAITATQGRVDAQKAKTAVASDAVLANATKGNRESGAAKGLSGITSLGKSK